MSFTRLGLSDQLVQGILATGYTAPTEIQTRAIPLAIAGRDIQGCAQTGTGKTAAFVLPILHHLSKPHGHGSHPHVRALVLTPTRELAQQNEDFATSYGRFLSLTSIAVFGGVNMENQIKRLRRGVDIVVATPGRLLDHLNRRTIDLSHVEILVLDEADRMFDMGFINDVRTIIAKIPPKRQTLLFSATMSKEVKALAAAIQHNPELVEVGEQQRPVEAIRQQFYQVEQDMKLTLLLHILRTQDMDSVLVFSRTKHGADKISRRLERSGLKSVAIHANRTQAQRQRALAGFKQRPISRRGGSMWKEFPTSSTSTLRRSRRITSIASDEQEGPH
jgi:ATP-dependent RNA helicase RhlE